MNGLDAFFHSSLSCAGVEIVTSKAQLFLRDTVAHLGLSLLVSLFVLTRDWSVLILWAVFLLLVAKELIFDLPNSGWSVLVAFDSVWDAITYVAGFLTVWWALSDAGVIQRGSR